MKLPEAKSDDCLISEPPGPVARSPQGGVDPTALPPQSMELAKAEVVKVGFHLGSGEAPKAEVAAKWAGVRPWMGPLSISAVPAGLGGFFGPRTHL